MKKYLSVSFSLVFIILLISMISENVSTHAASATPAVKQVDACSKAVKGYAQCLAIRVTGQSLLRPHTAKFVPYGYGPTDLQSAYKLPSLTSGKGQTIAIVDAYDNPMAEANLAVYRKQYNLSPCTTANGCFNKIDQTGGKHYPTPNAGWSEEIALDLDMTSAVCPNCRILLVEAKSASFGNLGDAVDTAVRLGANAVSNSYGGTEDLADALFYAHDYNHPGVAITASAGDNGYGVELPAAYNTVTAVGGTSLITDDSARGWNETVWNGTGSGCSAYVSKPSWQKDSGCKNRTVTDVAAVADPNTGVAVYNTYAGDSGWMVFGGTSASSPIVAGAYALAGNSAKVNTVAYPYAHTSALNTITSGSNGSCTVSYLCTAGTTGYNGPTGLGTPNGISAF